MIISCLVGVLMIIVGTALLSGQYLMTYAVLCVQQALPLVEGTETYKVWSSPLHVLFSCYLFNVTNPDEVMQGEYPNLVEYGPFTYTEVSEKQVLNVDEENDEITYTVRSTYIFEEHKSLNVSSQDRVTILNPAYVGTISMLASLPPNFMKTHGDNIPKLFPNASTIFLSARATDILFNGVKVKCNPKKFPELRLICMTLKGRARPPVLKETNEEGVYLLSIFQNVKTKNNTFRGPFAINRGLKNVSRLGDTTSYLGKRVQKIWNSDSCNRVRGTDTVTWAPLNERIPSVSTFVSDYCRSIETDYEYDLTIHGLNGYRYSMKERAWFLNESECYCPIVNKKAECLPQGLLDVSQCQNVPIVSSEPHFLHADPELLIYARGLKPDEKVHGTYVVIEPLSGTPLSGQKKTQLNLKLSRQPVKLLSNVSEGYFPLMWCESGSTPTLSVIAHTYQVVRFIRFVWFVQHLPLIIGIYVTLISLFMHEGRNIRPVISVTNPILMTPNLQENVHNVIRRPPRRSTQMFE